MSTPNDPGNYPPPAGNLGNPYANDATQQPNQSYGQQPSEPYAPQPGQPYGQPYSPQPSQPYGQQPSQPYGQPGEGQTPPMGQMPPMPPAATPAKKSRKGLWVTCGVLAGVLIVACALAGVFVVKPIVDKTQEVLAAATAAGTFCGDLKAGDASGAYNVLSSGYQAKVTADQFAQASKLHDQLDGTVTKCGSSTDTNSSSIHLSASSVTIPVTITRNKLYSGSVTLVKQGSAWKIDAIDASLQGTDLGPLQTASAYCGAILAGDLQTAYTMFSSAHQQTIGSEADYAATYQKLTESGIKITGCEPKLTTYSVSAGDDGASLDVTLNVSLTTDAGTQSQGIGFTLKFVKESGVWKIDDASNPNPA